MGQILRTENLAKLEKTSATVVSFGPSIIHAGGQEYQTSSTLTINTATTGLGGLESAVAANTTYKVWAVIVGSNVSLIAGTGVSPSGYAQYRELGKFFTNSSSQVANVLNTDIDDELYSVEYTIGTVGDTVQKRAGKYNFTIADFPAGHTGASFWRLSTATTTTDGSGNGRTLTNTGSMAFTGTGLFGEANTAAVCGTGKVLTSSHASFLNLNALDSWAMGGWFKANWTTATGALMSLADANDEVMVVQIASNALSIVTKDYGPAPAGGFATGFSDNTWHHIVVSSPGDGNYYLYVDGELKDFGRGQVGTLYESTILCFGASRADAASPFLNGFMQDVFFDTSSLTSSEIKKLYLYKHTHSLGIAANEQLWSGTIQKGTDHVTLDYDVILDYDEQYVYIDHNKLSDSDTIRLSARKIFNNPKPKLRWQRKTKATNTTTDGDILQFNNLEVGKTYRATFFSRTFVNNTGADSTFIWYLYNGNASLFEGVLRQEPPAAASEHQATESFSIIFVAKSNILKITTVSATSAAGFAGNPLAPTTLIVEELPDHIETSDFT